MLKSDELDVGEGHYVLDYNGYLAFEDYLL